MNKFIHLVVIFFTIILANNNLHAQWVQTSLPGNPTVFALTVNGVNILAGTNTGAYVSSDDGNSWSSLGLTDYLVFCFAASGTNLFAGTKHGIFLSTNDGASWTDVNSALTDTAVGTLAISGANIFAGTADGAFLSTNNGTSWAVIDSGLTDDFGVRIAINTIAIIGTNIFAGTPGEGVFLSTNNGTSWNAVNSGLAGREVFSLSVIDQNLFAATIGGVFRTTDYGTNWTSVNADLPIDYFISSTVSGGNLFTGTLQNGVYFSSNNGDNWTAINSGLPFNIVESLAVKDTNLFAGLLVNGAWRISLTDIVTSVKNSSADIPESFTLNQNYPNPFNPSTKISFQIPQNGYTTLKVYDVLGNEVATLVNEEKPAGNYEVEFDSHSDRGQNLSSGIYFYKLTAGSLAKTKKMMLMK